MANAPSIPELQNIASRILLLYSIESCRDRKEESTIQGKKCIEKVDPLMQMQELLIWIVKRGNY